MQVATRHQCRAGGSYSVTHLVTLGHQVILKVIHTVVGLGCNTLTEHQLLLGYTLTKH